MLLYIRQKLKFIIAIFFAELFFGATLFAKSENFNFDLSSTSLGDPFYFLFILVGITLLPFIAVMTTSFTKIVVVLSISRQAIGTSQTPPNIIIMSIAIMLTCFSMYPIATEIYASIDQKIFREKKGIESLMYLNDVALEPMRKFLHKHARSEDRDLFYGLMKKNSDEKTAANVGENDFIILAPAFLISELTLAFQIGFLIYLPFLVIDMTVANLLMALGMQMLAPTTISLPFKILLFVLIDGWHLLSEGLAKG